MTLKRRGGGGCRKAAAAQPTLVAKLPVLTVTSIDFNNEIRTQKSLFDSELGRRFFDVIRGVRHQRHGWWLASVHLRQMTTQVPVATGCNRLGQKIGPATGCNCNRLERTTTVCVCVCAIVTDSEC